MIRRFYNKTPIIIGGIEASLRRLGHYDYWSNKVKHSILVDSGADLISYGMGEHSIIEIADALNSGMDIKDITYIKGTVFKTSKLDLTEKHIILPDFDSISKDKKAYAKSFYTQYINTDSITGCQLVEKYRDNLYIVANPPANPLSQVEMDDIYNLPYMRTYHPSYKDKGGVPAIAEIKFSLVSNRGCFGGCNFCALTFHQGRIIQTRSHESIINEAIELTKDKDFKGYIHDVGGPTANFRAPACKKQLTKGVCSNKQCLFPNPCKNLEVDHKDYVALLQKLRKLPKVKKVFVRSGIRFDYLMADKDNSFFQELCKYNISGQLKVAPEHVSDNVLRYMGKPNIACYKSFAEKYKKYNEKLGMKQYLVPYLMSSHPGSTLRDAVILAEYVRDIGYNPEQVQDFYPTPSTISTCMYYTKLDPRTMEPVYIPESPHEKAMQRALIQYRNPANYELVKEALLKAGRADLIGFDKQCLIKPRNLDKASGDKGFIKNSKINNKSTNKNSNTNNKATNKNTNKPSKQTSNKNNKNSNTASNNTFNNKHTSNNKTATKKSKRR